MSKIKYRHSYLTNTEIVMSDKITLKTTNYYHD